MSKLKTITELLTLIILTFLFCLNTSVILAADSVSYSTHIQNIGWTDYVSDGQTSGTTGRALQVEAVKAKVNDGKDEIQYNTHVENLGWLTPVKNDQISGTTGRALQVEALNMVIVGEVAQRNDLYYRVHVSDVGWMGWAKNGDPAGTTGGAKQVEALEIKLVPKGQPAPGSTENSFIDFKDQKAKGPSVNGALRVEGNQLVSQNGTPIQLKGVSTHGIGWFPQYINQALFNELHQSWNANLIRLAMYTAEGSGYCTGGDQNHLKDLIKSGINYASQADLYVIVDWHVLSDRDPNIYKEQAKSFFNEISSAYKDNNNIIYEICNEPNSGPDWASIKRYANEVIPIIRANDPDAIIIVGTPTWSQDVDQAVINPINNYNNIMYAFHFYAATHKDQLRSKFINAYNSGLPIFVSEFGICDASGNGALDLTSAGQWFDLINANKISYAMWNLSNKAESSSLINSSVNKTSGFSRAELSQSGQWLLDMLQSPGLTPGTNPSNPETTQPNPPTSTNGTVEYSLSQTNSWVSGNDSFYQYVLTVKNNSQGSVNNWNTLVKFNQPFDLTSSWNGNFTKEGNNLKIGNVDYNGNLNPGDTAEVGFIVQSQAGLNFTI